jgi:hypothetical protein
MSRIRIGIVALLAFAAIAAVMPAAALAAKSNAVHHVRTATVFGTLTSFDATSAVVTTVNGPVNINLTANTDYLPNNQAAAVAGFKDGDQVFARGTFRNGFWTTSIRYDLVPFVVSALTRFDGKYQVPASAVSTTLTILIRKGVTRTFNTDANTNYYDDGKIDKTPAHDLTPNVPLTVWALEYSNSSWLAKSVVIHDSEAHNG